MHPLEKHFTKNFARFKWKQASELANELSKGKRYADSVWSLKSRSKNDVATATGCRYLAILLTAFQRQSYRISFPPKSARTPPNSMARSYEVDALPLTGSGAGPLRHLPHCA